MSVTANSRRSLVQPFWVKWGNAAEDLSKIRDTLVYCDWNSERELIILSRRNRARRDKRQHYYEKIARPEPNFPVFYYGYARDEIIFHM